MRGRRGFTLLEVMIAVAILGLASAGGLRLLAMSARALEAVRFERRNLELARSLWLKAAGEGLDERGREDGCSWETREFAFDRQESVPEGFACKKVVLVQSDPAPYGPAKEAGSFVFYLPDSKNAKERTE